MLPRIWDRNPEEGHRRLEELRQLTRGALAEMRTLLLELRHFVECVSEKKPSQVPGQAGASGGLHCS